MREVDVYHLVQQCVEERSGAVVCSVSGVECYPCARECVRTGTRVCYSRCAMRASIRVAPIDVHGRKFAAEEDGVGDLVGAAEGGQLCCSAAGRQQDDVVTSLEGARDDLIIGGGWLCV